MAITGTRDLVIEPPRPSATQWFGVTAARQGVQAVSTPLLGLFAALLVVFAAEGGPTYDTSRHGDPVTGVQRLPDETPGACAQCHESHGSRYGVPNSGPYNKTLFTADNEHLCYECHRSNGAHEVYQGSVVWTESSHSRSPDAWWRGPDPRARSPQDAGKCVNCHDPHGADDAQGAIPSMLRVREQNLCIGCHKGSPATDVKADLEKAYRHPVALSGRHTAGEAAGGNPAHYAAGASNQRHAECADCHNTHVASRDLWDPVAPDSSRRIEGVSRISVLNRAAGQTPTYVWRGAADPTRSFEFELCFKCHSSWTTLPAGAPDLALLTNPNNASYHPIQATGKNRNIDPAAFTEGWTWDRQVYCSDCHGSDDERRRGPHGSTHRHLLKRPVATTTARQPMAPSDLCFSCHSYDVYANPASPAATQRASRFNLPADRGHAYHVGEQQIPCYTCHETHGSATQPALIAAGRPGGVAMFTAQSSGGSCATSCHQTRTYDTNYAR